MAILNGTEIKVYSASTNNLVAFAQNCTLNVNHSPREITNKESAGFKEILEGLRDFSIDIDGEFKQDAVFNFIISISNLKILPGDYEVEISSKLITQFKHKEMPLKYWIALEKTSTYGA